MTPSKFLKVAKICTHLLWPFLLNQITQEDRSDLAKHPTAQRHFELRLMVALAKLLLSDEQRLAFFRKHNVELYEIREGNTR